MFNEEWLRDPELRSWVSGCPGDDYAYCTVCNKVLVVNGKSTLRAHARGVKHTELMIANRRNRTARSRPRPASRTSSNPARVPNQMSSGTGMNVFVLRSGPITPPSMEEHQHNTNRQERDLYLRARSFVRTRQSPRTTIEVEDDRHGEVARTNEFVEKVEAMLSQHDTVIRGDISDFLNLYQRFLNQRPSTSSSYFEHYNSVKSVLDDYKRRHEALRREIKARLVSIL